MFKKKRIPDLQMKKWTKQMLSPFREDMFNRIEFVPMSKEIEFNIENGMNFHHETYLGKTAWYEGGDILCHLMVLDEGDPDLSKNVPIGYFRLVNYDNLPRVYIYLKNEKDLRGKISVMFNDFTTSRDKIVFSIEYEAKRLIPLSDEELVGNKEENNIPIISFNVSGKQSLND